MRPPLERVRLRLATPDKKTGLMVKMKFAKLAHSLSLRERAGVRRSPTGIS